MNRRLITLSVTLMATLAIHAQAIQLDSLYKALDDAIEHADTYLRQKENKIETLRGKYLSARDDAQRYQFAHSLFEEYRPFVNDSALAYLYICIDEATKMHRDDLKEDNLLRLATQYTGSGFYNEAVKYFDDASRLPMTQEQRVDYLNGLCHLYGEMGYYTKDPELKRNYQQLALAYTDTLYHIVDKKSITYLWRHTLDLNNKQKYDESMMTLEQWRKSVEPGTRDYAIMSFFMSETYRQLGDIIMQKYWLLQSALSDVKSATMDQSALWSLARVLIKEGQVKRAHRYMDFSWQCISRYSTHMRSWLVSPVLTLINDNYKKRLESANHWLIFSLALVSLLALLLVAQFVNVSRKKKNLTMARNALKSTNEELEQLNNKLQEANAQLTETNARLHEVNKVKDEYIGKFLSLCSQYIDKLENFRVRIYRKAKANLYDDIINMTNTHQLKEDELTELFNHFDTVFLHLFPNFVDGFNALLREDSRIVPPEEGKLTTDLRIFALVRLGIEESSKIAEFLHYSPNSIYNYRARIKSKAICGRDEFEKHVKEIGLK